MVAALVVGCGDDGGATASAGNTDGGTGSTGATTTQGSSPTSGETATEATVGTNTNGNTTCVAEADCETTAPTSEPTTADTGATLTSTSPGTLSDTSSESGGSTTTGGSDDSGTTSPVSMSEPDTGSSSGTTGEPCEGAECCEKDEVYCGAVCCAVGEVCNFTKCEVPGVECDEPEDCAGNEYCDVSLGQGEVQPPDPMCMGGVILPTGKCLTKPPLCGPNDPPQDPEDPDCLQSCEFDPAGGFNPDVKYTWGGVINPPYNTDIMMTPIVVQLDDDDCDGVVTERDIPEIVFSTFTSGAYGTNGSMHAISVENGKLVEKWNVLAGAVNPTKQLAGGNIDGQPGNEVVGCGIGLNPVQVYARKGEDGAALWQTQVTSCFMPSIADLEGDGAVEVIVEHGVLDGATGAVKATFSPPLNGSFIVADLDLDGKLDVVTSSRGYRADGTVFVNTMLADQSAFPGDEDWKSPWPAIADFNKDGVPEVVVIDNLNHALSIWRYDDKVPSKFTVVRSPVDINGGLSPALCPNGSWGNTHGGGPPTVADFDGDGVPDVGTAGGIGYAVFSGAKLIDPATPGPMTFLWIKQTKDCSSASTGSSVFDFDGDGKAEVVYSDQNRLRVYEGPTGNILIERCNSTATLIENPVVADVDNDGQADIVVVSNAYAKADPNIMCAENGATAQAGVRVFGAAGGKWVRTRRVWNQHAYYVTNVDEDGSVPAMPPPNWTTPGLNNFRQNKQPDSEFGAPDAIVAIAPLCEDMDYSLVATVRNVGEASLPSGVAVGYYIGDPPNGMKVGELSTSKALYPLESQQLVLPYNDAPQDVKDGVVNIYAVVDDTDVPHPAWAECRTDNNTGTNSGKCLMPN
ncbi:MAG: VCBS repeat-containing protein [Myxococcales bacterium]|nr:VCBS repeat-containing protein [Myxococcales bacterium]